MCTKITSINSFNLIKNKKKVKLKKKIIQVITIKF